MSETIDSSMNQVKIATLRDISAFQAHVAALSLDFPCDDAIITGTDAPLARSLTAFGKRIGNRFAIQPMEGWDGTTEGRPSEHTIRRWRRFGESGAKLIWGGEAVAVRPDGRANPNQLMINPETLSDLAGLRDALMTAHREAMGSTDDLVIGLQLTHSGRFARPNDKKRMEPRILYRHPILDKRFGLGADYPLLTDGEIHEYIDDIVTGAKRAHDLGFDFVDIKHCHGYLGHEFLSAFTREGAFGGSFENRTRFLREIVAGIEATAPGLGIGVRLSAFDMIPFMPDPVLSSPGKPGPGIPEPLAGMSPYRFGFGVDAQNPTRYDLTEVFELFALFQTLGVGMVNVTAGSPYYNPHIQRPALYPPSDGYRPPEDPLVGVYRQMEVCRLLKEKFPEMPIVGTGYTYLQEFLPNVAQAAVRDGWADFVGLGRMMLSYPELPRDVLTTGTMQKKRLCRTFSDCTTAPRNGLISGCYPLDDYYRKSPERAQLNMIKEAGKIK